MNFATVEDTYSLLKNLPGGSLMEFGVLNGSCMRRILKGAADNNYWFDHVYGFDSWSGLPKEKEGEWENPDWKAGAFSLKQDIDVKTDEECITYVTNRIYEFLSDDTIPPLTFYSGFFTESLTRERGEKLTGKVSYLHVDVDLYISTAQCLDWVFTHKVLLPGCVVRYDDWLYNVFAGNNKAFYEMTNKYEIVWQPLCDNVFLYLSQGK